MTKYHLEVYVRCMILWMYSESGTATFQILSWNLVAAVSAHAAPGLHTDKDSSRSSRTGNSLNPPNRPKHQES